MKESVYTWGRANNCLLFARLRGAPVFQRPENRYIDLGCIFGRKLLKIQNIKKIGKQNITTSFYNWCDFLLMSNCEVFPGNFQHFQGTLMLLPSAKKEEKYFVYLKKTSPNWKIFFFFSQLFGSGENRFPVSFAGGEVQLPVSRITRGFNRDTLSALLCAYNELWIADVIGNRLFWIIKHLDLEQRRVRPPMASRCAWFSGRLEWSAAGIVEWGRSGHLFLVPEEKKVNHSLILFPSSFISVWERAVSIYRNAFFFF